MKLLGYSIILSCALSSLAHGADLSKPNAVVVLLSAIGNGIGQSLPTSSSTQKTSFWLGVCSLTGASIFLLPKIAEYQQSKCELSLKDALYSGASLKTIKTILNSSPNIQETVNNAMGAKKITPLMCASWKGDPEIVQFLIGKKASLDSRDADGNTALMHAVQRGNKKCILLLACAGADIALPSNGGTSPIQYIKHKMGINRIYSRVNLRWTPIFTLQPNSKVELSLAALKEYRKLLQSNIKIFFNEAGCSQTLVTDCILLFLVGDLQETTRNSQIEIDANQDTNTSDPVAEARWADI